MIAIDTSALMAIVLNETEADACAGALEAEDRLLISAGTVAEALIVAARRNVSEEMAQLVDGLGLEIVSVTPASARRIAEVYEKWGKGIHPASLNFGDCFAYEVAKEYECRLLYVGEDFTQTDVEGVL
jgi:ribonuclease VapC